MSYNSEINELIDKLLKQEKDRLNQTDLKLKIVNVNNSEVKTNLDLISALIDIVDRCLIIGQVSRALKYVTVLKYRIDMLIADVNSHNVYSSKCFLK